MKDLAPLSALVLGVVQAFIAVLVAFGVDLTTDQIAAITGAFGALLALVGAWYHPKIPFGDQKSSP